MKYYFAPLESITGYPLRNAHRALFLETDKYFSPFISSNEEGHYTGRIERDCAPNNNESLTLVPQIMGNRPDFVFATIEYLETLGYEECNLNLGCPSGTVVAKGKGSGMLRDLMALEDFFQELFSLLKDSKMKLSVKTRIGLNGAEEWEELFSLYNHFPISELIVHPRTQKQYYSGKVDLSCFQKICERTRIPLVYNGDVETKEDLLFLAEQFPHIKGIMCGRGLLSNPALFREAEGGKALEEGEFKAFLALVEENFAKEIQGERNILAKYKEFWSYFSKSYQGGEKGLKEIRKAKNLAEYKGAKYRFFAESHFQPREGLSLCY